MLLYDNPVVPEMAALASASVYNVGAPVNEPYAPSNASVIPYPAIVVGVPVSEPHAPSKCAPAAPFDTQA